MIKDFRHSRSSLHPLFSGSKIYFKPKRLVRLEKKLYHQWNRGVYLAIFATVLTSTYKPGKRVANSGVETLGVSRI
jgi:hypothetical protein